MLFALASVVSGWSCPQLTVGSYIKPPVPLEAFCIVSGKLSSGHAIRVEADSGSPGTPLCLRVQTLGKTGAPTHVEEGCGRDGRVAISLPDPNEAHTYVIYPRSAAGSLPRQILVAAREVSGAAAANATATTTAAAAAARSLASPPPPVNAMARSRSGAASVPPPPKSPAPFPSTDDSDCNVIEGQQLSWTLKYCQADYLAFCNNVIENNILSCLEQNKGRSMRGCRAALDILDDCLLQPHLLVPMTIASILLLATASMVLLCTLLRCCCRYICVMPVHPADDASTVHDEELSEADDDVGSVTPLPSGVKMVETAQPEPQPEEDELPAYTEVVQGASIARASNSKEPLTAASSPPGHRRSGSRDANYRPDVQLQ